MRSATAPPVSMVSFTNQLGLDDAGWAQLAPFGDFPGQALLCQPDGSMAKFAAIQRLGPRRRRGHGGEVQISVEPAETLLHRLPDLCRPPGRARPGERPSRQIPKGMIVDLQVRDGGLYCKPVFTEEGSDLVENRRLRAFSAYWSASEVASQEYADGSTLKIYRPDALKSAGLTNHPNLPVQLLNEKPASTTDDPSPQTPTQYQIVNRQLILNFLAANGLTLGADDTEIQIASALEQLGGRIQAADAALAARNRELEAATVELANERRFHADALLDCALATGAITAAERPQWAERLTADFANAAAELAQLPPRLKTKALTLNFGARKAEIANVSGRRAAVDTLVKAEMAANGGDYPRAFAAVQRANPALFAEMKQPALD